jgi:hypothetical protein
MQEKQRLHELLETVHQELDAVKSVNEEERVLLRDLMGEIREVLDKSEEKDAGAYFSLGDRLEAALRQWEVSHPGLVSAIRGFINSLPR